MPIERREISFRSDELFGAIAYYGRQTPGVMPDGDLLQVKVAAGTRGQPEVVLRIALTVRDATEEVEIHLSGESILELMIQHCRQDGIPMPRSGNKKVVVLDGLLTLVIDHGGNA